jgi:hypothetical protein
MIAWIYKTLQRPPQEEPEVGVKSNFVGHGFLGTFDPQEGAVG